MLAYTQTGEGPSVLLLHAFPLDGRMWPPLDGYRQIAVDLPGFGNSPGGAWTVESAAEQVVALLDRLGIPQAAVVGLSMGGYVALALADRHPARVAALVLCDTRAAADSATARAARDSQRQLLSDGRRAEMIAPLIDKLLGPSAAPEVRARVSAQIADQPDAALAAGLLALRDRPDRSALLPSLRLPSLVLVGSADVITPPEEARQLAAAIPGAELEILGGAGHLSAVEQPAAFSAAVRTFLERSL